DGDRRGRGGLLRRAARGEGGEGEEEDDGYGDAEAMAHRGSVTESAGAHSVRPRTRTRSSVVRPCLADVLHHVADLRLLVRLDRQVAHRDDADDAVVLVAYRDAADV